MFNSRFTTLALLLAALAAPIAEAQTPTREVKYGDITLTVPESWKEQKPSSRLRLAQFAIPGAEGADAAELGVFSFGRGGSVAQNLERWKGQFEAEGREFTAVVGESGTNGQYAYTDIHGTYKKPDGPPFLQRTKPVPNSRMLGVIFSKSGQGYFFLKLVGPKETVTAHVKHFRGCFGTDETTEKPAAGN